MNDASSSIIGYLMLHEQKIFYDSIKKEYDAWYIIELLLDSGY